MKAGIVKGDGIKIAHAQKEIFLSVHLKFFPQH
jgi:hypothetical protein